MTAVRTNLRGVGALTDVLLAHSAQAPLQLARTGRLAKAIHVLQNYEITAG